MSLTSLLGFVTGVFSRRFWFGIFLPLLTFAAVNFALAIVLLGVEIKREDWASFGEGALTNGTLAIAGLIVLSYAVSPLLPVFRGVFDGRLLPGWLYDRLRAERQAEATRLNAAQDAAKTAAADTKTVEDDFNDEVRDAVAAGGIAAKALAENKAGAQPVDPVALAAAIARVDGLYQSMAQGRIPTAKELEPAATMLLGVVRTGDAPEFQPALDRMVGVLRFASTSARDDFIALANRDFGLSITNPQATRIGDARMIVESYAKQMYNAEFAFIWPRLALVYANDEKLSGGIEMAESQVDFSALSLVLSLLTAFAWPVLVVVYRCPVWDFLLIMLLAPLGVALFYRLLFESQLGLVEVVKLTMDSKRLDLLTTVLHQPLPATLSAERGLWKDLVFAQRPGIGTEIIYRHPKAGAQP